MATFNLDLIVCIHCKYIQVVFRFLKQERFWRRLCHLCHYLCSFHSPNVISPSPSNVLPMTCLTFRKRQFYPTNCRNLDIRIWNKSLHYFKLVPKELAQKFTHFYVTKVNLTGQRNNTNFQLPPYCILLYFPK